MFEALRHYIRSDHKTRFRNNVISVIVAAAAYALCRYAHFTEAVATNVSVAVLCISYVIAAILYVHRYNPAKEMMVQEPESRPPITRRRIVVSLLWLLVLVFMGLGSPFLEAAAVDRRLRALIKGEPTDEKLNAARQIVTEVQQHKLRASPKLVVDAANHFSTYQSAQLTAPLSFHYFDTLTWTPNRGGASVSLAFGCIEAPSPLAEGASFGFGGVDSHAHIEIGKCSHLVVFPPKEAIQVYSGRPVVLSLDNLESRNTIVLNCTLTYNGSKLKLNNVQFVNCIFHISDVYAKNQNVLEFLTTAMTGNPITLDLTA